MSQFTGRSTDINVVFDLMIHDLEIIISLLDGEPKLHHALGFSFITGKLDFATATLKFNGCTAELTSSRVYDRKLRRLDVFFPSGLYAKVDFAEAVFAKFLPKGDGIEQEWTKSVTTEPLMRQLENFSKAIRRETNRIDYSAVKALKLAEEISKVAENSL